MPFQGFRKIKEVIKRIRHAYRSPLVPRRNVAPTGFRKSVTKAISDNFEEFVLGLNAEFHLNYM